MDKSILGLHHVTAIASDPQRNVDFYVGVLGLRLVKRTVNFDDPATYHLYYGDDVGHPGTILTFFPWPGAPRGRRGIGQATVTAFSIPESSMGYWHDRLKTIGVEIETPVQRFDADVLTFYDPDGLQLELVAEPDSRTGWREGPIPAEHAIRGFHSVTLAEEGFERTAALLTETMGFRMVRDDGSRFRYEAGSGGAGNIVDVLCVPSGPYGQMGAGVVHHIAWRAPDDSQQIAWRVELAAQGYNVTPVMDRQYFHSIYYREPGGVLFEIATDPPGFTRDESKEQLGTHLKLPPWLEPYRERIEGVLPPLNVPATGGGR